MTEFERLVLRVQARRVAVIAEMAGQPIPAGAAAILRDVPLAQADQDNRAYAAWCAAHGLEAPLHRDGHFEWGWLSDGSVSVPLPAGHA